MCCDKNNENGCLESLVRTIIALQTYDDDCCSFGGCDKPFLGPTPVVQCYNTRPVNLYSCCTGDIWTLPFTNDGVTGTSSIFRIESIERSCVTLRILTASPAPTDISPYVATDSYFTIDLNCVSAIKCLPDVYVPCN